MQEQLRQKRGSRLRGTRAIVLSCGSALLLAVGAWLSPALAGSTPDPNRPDISPAAPKAPGPTWVRSLEAGGGVAEYSDDLGRSDSQFLRAGISRPWRYGWVVDVGREHRFDETSFNYGASYTQFLPGRTNLTVAIGSGTGEILAPRYRLGVTASGSILGLVTSAGYLRVQSKAENWSDGFSLGLLRYTGHWIFGVSGRQDYGYPGRTVSRSGGAGITWFQWRRTYLGANVDFGKVSYMLVGPAQAKVNFNSTTYGVGFSRWFTDRTGMNLRGTYGRTSFYKVGGVTVSLFREW
jgi:YaiO family outer membrane protein